MVFFKKLRNLKDRSNRIDVFLSILFFILIRDFIQYIVVNPYISGLLTDIKGMIANIPDFLIEVIFFAIFLLVMDRMSGTFSTTRNSINNLKLRWLNIDKRIDVILCIILIILTCVIKYLIFPKIIPFLINLPIHLFE